MLAHLPPCSQPPGEWIRIAATRIASQHPEIDAQEVLRRAIDAFSLRAHLPPEEAVAVH